MKRNLGRAAQLVAALACVVVLSAYHHQGKTVKIKKSKEAVALQLPTGFKATVVADDLGAVRHLVVTKQGDLYVKLTKLKDGKGLYHLRDTDKDGYLDQQTGIGNYPGTGIALQNNYLYSASNTGVYRYLLNAKQEILKPEQPESIVQGLVAKTRDVSKSITLDKQGNLYVTVGSYSDACRQEGSGKGQMPCPLLDSVGGIWQFKTDKPNQSYGNAVHYATGLKNVVGLDWNSNTNSLFALQHGRGAMHDLFPQYYTPEQDAILPAETLYELPKGADGGWPYIYYDHQKKQKMLAPEYGGDGQKTGGETALDPLVAFPAHLAPNALLFYTGNMFPARYKNGAFIAFHGKSAELQKGYVVAFIPFKNGKPAGKWEIFADNFAGVDLVQPTGPIQHRPCGLAQGPDGALYVSDDLKGTVYRITYANKK
ncbi:PQQ-dependent sugar dehydrogenase [Adhaeribacter swui]|uniref:PQQ-dependent sugar dehydrogenase n=1 Tax=Adhaeribacter swui TaxID=2086471 RepID=A0A7G7G9D0_9BACT|nr:PQQ-dependent sugar dehydrogenase [Adhaeribacter swui]QNF33764.1 PQQ-dependent sugar dehydrogenase [Adhaeribacter swui]